MLRVQLPNASLTSQLSVSELISNGFQTSADANVDVYHFCLGTSSTTSNNSSSSGGTANNAEQGTLFHVGRKYADVEFTNEKSVSRKHCRVRIISSNGASGSKDSILSPKSRKNKDHPSYHHEPSVPSTEEERNECESTTDGIIFILEDLGSKFGTRIYYEKSHDVIAATTTASTSTDPNASDENDETDDEQFPSQGQQSSSLPSLLNFDMDSHTMKTVEKNGHLILHCLSSYQQTSISPSPLKSVLVQCGSAYFTISRIPMEFCTSRISASSKKKLESVAPYIGAVVTNVVHPKTMTHLIAPDQMSSAKNISAWIMNVPVVTEDYVYAIADRKQGNDPMPKVEDYICQKVESEFTFDDPKSKTAQLSVKDRQNILSGYKILNLNDSHPEIENMCKCAGAIVVQLYRKWKGKLDVKFWQNQKFFEELKMKQEKDGLELVWLDPGNATKFKKGKDYLAKMTQDGLVRLSCIDMFEGAAKAIQDVNDLVDLDGKPVMRNVTFVEMKSDAHANQSIRELSTEEVATVQAHQSPHDINLSLDARAAVCQNQEDMAVEYPVPSHSNDVHLPKNNASRKRKVTSQEESVMNDASFDHDAEENEDTVNIDHSCDWQSSRNKTSKRSKRDTQTSLGWMNSQNRQSHQDEHDIDEEIDEESSGLKTANEPKVRRMQLVQVLDGWMVTAPSGKERSKLKRSVHEMNEIGEENARDAADTIRMNLIVRTKAEVEAIRVSRLKNTKKRGSKDFKRFVKNSIIPGIKEHTFSGIHLVSVSANESDRRRELEEEEANLERQQRAADDLFNEGGLLRIGDGSIRNFFKGPTTNNSRRRRLN
jgi:hypothetical protein